jgi:hypothetical protein
VASQHQQAAVNATTPSSTKKPPSIPSGTDVEHLRQYNKQYLGIPNFNPVSTQLKTFYTNLCYLHTVGTATSIKGLNYCTIPDTIPSKIIVSVQQKAPDSAYRCLSNDTSFKSIRPNMPKLWSTMHKSTIIYRMHTAVEHHWKLNQPKIWNIIHESS